MYFTFNDMHHDWVSLSICRSTSVIASVLFGYFWDLKKKSKRITFVEPFYLFEVLTLISLSITFKKHKKITFKEPLLIGRLLLFKKKHEHKWANTN